MTKIFKRFLDLMFAYRSESAKGKKAYRSKTIWVNIIAIASAILANYGGVNLTEGEQLIILAFINIVLRLISKEPVGFYEERNELR